MPTVSIDGVKTPVTKGSSGMATATVPNICKMPGPPAPFVPTPLPNIGQSGKQPQGYSTSVQIEGNPVAITGANFASSGDIASKGTGGGLISSNAEGVTSFVAPGSLDVQIEGKNVQLLGDQMLNNGAPGQGVPPNSATMAGVLQAPAPAAMAALGEDSKSDDDDGTKLKLKIFLLDDCGERLKNGPYRLVVRGDVRTGSADGDGVVNEDKLPDVETGELQWGMLDEVSPGTPPPKDDDGAAKYFMYSQRVYFRVDPDDGSGLRRQLFNLGYVGGEDDQRSGFSFDYKKDEDSDIKDVHGSGKEWSHDDEDDEKDDEDEDTTDEAAPAFVVPVIDDDDEGDDAKDDEKDDEDEDDSDESQADDEEEDEPADDEKAADDDSDDSEKDDPEYTADDDDAKAADDDSDDDEEDEPDDDDAKAADDDSDDDEEDEPEDDDDAKADDDDSDDDDDDEKDDEDEDADADDDAADDDDDDDDDDDEKDDEDDDADADDDAAQEEVAENEAEADDGEGGGGGDDDDDDRGKSSA
jgi:hypothetical protein